MQPDERAATQAAKAGYYGDTTIESLLTGIANSILVCIEKNRDRRKHLDSILDDPVNRHDLEIAKAGIRENDKTRAGLLVLFQRTQATIAEVAATTFN